MKVLNLYACLGGNRYKWDNCEVTAVELDEHLAELYQKRFPNDKVIVADAHQYLLDHYKKFDFIWSSPPCTSHSLSRLAHAKGDNSTIMAIFPDLKLYEEILLLKWYFKGKYCVENVNPYYEPLIPAQKRGRHLYWTNFLLPTQLSNRIGLNLEDATLNAWSKYHNYDFKQYKGKKKVLSIARNLVDYEAGLTIFKAAQNIYEKSNTSQLSLL